MTLSASSREVARHANFAINVICSGDPLGKYRALNIRMNAEGSSPQPCCMSAINASAISRWRGDCRRFRPRA